MLEKDPKGLIEALIETGITAKEEIIVEKKRDGSVPTIKIKAFFSQINNEKSSNGPFISAGPKSTSKVFPKKFGFTMNISGEYIIFQ